MRQGDKCRGKRFFIFRNFRSCKILWLLSTPKTSTLLNHILTNEVVNAYADLWLYPGRDASCKGIDEKRCSIEIVPFNFGTWKEKYSNNNNNVVIVREATYKSWNRNCIYVYCVQALSVTFQWYNRIMVVFQYLT